MAETNPPQEDAFAAGMDAYGMNKPETSNPYDPEEEETAYYDWNDGYHEARKHADS